MYIELQHFIVLFDFVRILLKYLFILVHICSKTFIDITQFFSYGAQSNNKVILFDVLLIMQNKCLHLYPLFFNENPQNACVASEATEAQLIWCLSSVNSWISAENKTKGLCYFC